jgi:hypothetical protein
MAKKIKRLTGVSDTIDCACLIHDTLYDWSYVDKLYNSLCRNLTPTVRMHVYTESTRHVPQPYIRHNLEEWEGVRGPKRSWWYKIQLFNPIHMLPDQGQMLYFDLDTVIVGNIDWLWNVNRDRFWAARDFQYLMKSSRWKINSSVMWFDPLKYSYVFKEFDIKQIVNNARCPWHGDQDYIFSKVKTDVNYYNTDQILSYRWQVKEGGFDFRYRKPINPGAESTISGTASVLIFHGNPKPHEVTDNLISQHWR